MAYHVYHVSSCCQAPVFSGTKVDRMVLGMGEYNGVGIRYVIDVCEDCGKETDPVIACESCGKAADTLIETTFGNWCEACISDYAAKDGKAAAK